MTKLEKLIEIIEAEKFYFGATLENVESIADKFINAWENGNTLPWKFTPSILLEDEVFEILEKEGLNYDTKK